MPLSMNRYSYCFNDPMLLVDLDGAWPEWLDVSEKGAKDKIRDNKENINKGQLLNKSDALSDSSEHQK